jgi:hypothetical protein
VSDHPNVRMGGWVVRVMVAMDVVEGVRECVYVCHRVSGGALSACVVKV